MPDELYELITEPRDGYLYACLKTANVGLEVMVKYGNELAAAIRSTGLRKVLFENHAPILYDRAKYAIAASLFRNLVQGGVRIAVVDRGRSEPGYLKQATQAVKAAGLDIAYFDSIESATDWLATVEE